MSARNDEGCPGQGIQSSSNSSTPKGTTPDADWHVVPRVTYVIAGSGRGRWLLVYTCPSCAAYHVSHARDLRPRLRRKTACGLAILLRCAVDLEQVAS